jgi:hypothetical protein
VSAPTQPQRVARVYTAARRHPWVLGKLGDWTIWFGPYTPAQLLVTGGGALLLIKTFAWWSWLGPMPVVLWLVAIWAVRGATIGGRSPIAAAFGWITLLPRHPAGRIAGRAARDRRATPLAGAFVIEPAPARTPAAAADPAAQGRPVRSARSSRRRSASPAAVVRPVPVSGLDQLLRDAQVREMAGRS